ncbi:MAG: S8/S53 family peptidase [Bdellovibrionota bacterium]
MKKLVLILLAILSTLAEASSAPNVLFVDSSFPPLVNPKISFRPPNCAWLSETEAQVPATGTCYDVAEWSELSAEDAHRLRGLVDHLSGTTSPEAQAWQEIEASEPAEARRVKGVYLLSVHGTRSIAVAALSSQGKLRPLALRNLSSKAGADIEQTQGAGALVNTRTKNVPYKNGCLLYNWTEADMAGFRAGGMRRAQSRIAETLALNPTLRIVNISLGYKRSWILDDNPKCDAAQVDKEYAALESSWKNLFAKFADRLFIAAAGNETENFDKIELRHNDLWARLSTTPNLILVGAMTALGTRLPSSNLGLPVSIFALGEHIPALSPLPTVIAGHPSRLQGTSFAAPLVSGRAIALWEKNPKLALVEMKALLVKTFNDEQLHLLFAQFEKVCRGEKALNACLDAIADLISRPLLWSDTHLLYVKGRTDWKFKPFAIQFQKDLPVLGQTRLVEVGGEALPTLILKPSDNPYELLITLHHEIYHFSSMAESAKTFTSSGRVNACITPYQLALLRDEIPAYERESRFFETAPVWFKKKLTGKKYRSQLLDKNVDAPNFYKELRAATTKDSKFLVRRFVDLGAYPPCVLDLF